VGRQVVSFARARQSFLDSAMRCEEAVMGEGRSN
jgi:hypothetical protein